MFGDTVPASQGQGPALPWSFGDSVWLSLENMPLIGSAVRSMRGADSATIKAADIYVKSTGIPNPSVADLGKLADQIGGGLQSAANLLTVGLVVGGLYYGYKIIKEIKS